jgi:hypothetical protein
MHVKPTCTGSNVTTAIYDKSNVCSASNLCELYVISFALILNMSTHNCISCTLNKRNATPMYFPPMSDNHNNLDSVNNSSYPILSKPTISYLLIIAMALNLLIRIIQVKLVIRVTLTFKILLMYDCVLKKCIHTYTHSLKAQTKVVYASTCILNILESAN